MSMDVRVWRPPSAVSLFVDWYGRIAKEHGCRALRPWGAVLKAPGVRDVTLYVELAQQLLWRMAELSDKFG